MATHEPLSETMEDYLEAVYVLDEDGSGARTGDVAKRVQVHKSTATAALHTLAEHQLVHYEPYKPVRLTRTGRRLGARILRRHQTLRRFLMEVLGIEGSAADDTACKMEHAIPPEIIDRFTAFADFVERCPRAGSQFSEGFGYFCTQGREHPDCEDCLSRACAQLRSEHAGNKKTEEAAPCA